MDTDSQHKITRGAEFELSISGTIEEISRILGNDLAHSQDRGGFIDEEGPRNYKDYQA